MWPALALGLSLTGTVDRIEGDWAVVEWVDGSMSDLPLDAVPKELREGDSIVMRVRIGGRRLDQKGAKAQRGHAGRAHALQPPLAARVLLPASGTQPGRPSTPSKQRSNP